MIEEFRGVLILYITGADASSNTRSNSCDEEKNISASLMAL
jgi:hypothetical protein